MKLFSLYQWMCDLRSAATCFREMKTLFPFIHFTFWQLILWIWHSVSFIISSFSVNLSILYYDYMHKAFSIQPYTSIVCWYTYSAIFIANIEAVLDFWSSDFHNIRSTIIIVMGQTPTSAINRNSIIITIIVSVFMIMIKVFINGTSYIWIELPFICQVMGYNWRDVTW